MGSSLTACLIREEISFIMIPGCPNLKSVMGAQTDERNSVLLFIAWDENRSSSVLS
jgi:hypothetical protein